MPFVRQSVVSYSISPAFLLLFVLIMVLNVARITCIYIKKKPLLCIIYSRHVVFYCADLCVPVDESVWVGAL